MRTKHQAIRGVLSASEGGWWPLGERSPVLRSNGSFTRIAASAAVCAATALVITGCGGGPEYELARVSGRVTLDGNPVTEVRVTFQPKAKGEKNINPGPGSYAITDQEGRFELGVVAPESEGAVVGMHSVRFKHPESSKYRFPFSGRNAGMEFEVPPQGTDAANFDFKSRRRRK